MLRRALRKYLPIADKNVEVLVIDGSEDSEQRNKNKTEIRQAEREYRKKVRYVSRRELEAYSSRLGKKGLDPQEVTGSVIGKTGAARNAALLDTLGRQVIFVDDDTAPVLYAAARATTAVIRRGATNELGSDPTVFWFYPSRGEVFVDLRVMKNEEFLQEALGLLGAPVETTWGKLRSQGLLVKGERCTGRIAAVTFGVAGDVASLRWEAYPTLKDSLSKINHRNAGGVRRSVIRASVEETIQRGPFMQINAVALDNTRVLPPFAPFESMGGLEGGSLYGRFLTAYADTFVAHRPWAVHHDPPDFPSFDVAEVYKVRTRDLVTQIVEGKNLPEIVPSLATVADLSEKEFRQWAKEAIKYRATKLSSELSVRISDSSLLEVYDQSKSVLEGTAHQEDLKGFVTTLRTWSDMVQATKELQEDGIRLSVEL